MKRIPVAGPWITDKEIAYVKDAAQNAWYSNANKYNDKFEKSFSDYIDVKYCVALPSCTSAIHLSLLSLGIGPGDEVIVPEITWIATAAPISYVGATPVFADIDPQTWCIDAQSLTSCITEKTKAIIAVDLYGNTPDLDEILEVSEKFGLPIIEDAAEAIGSEYKGKKAGSFGKTGVFSFHGSKTLTTGEGGLLCTDDIELYKRVLFLRDHGRLPGDVSFSNLEIAYKYKMSALQAAFGLAQIERIDALVDKKREIFSWYAEILNGMELVRLNTEPKGTKNSYWMTTVIVDNSIDLPKMKLMRALHSKGIDSRPFFNPLSSIPAYEHCKQSKNARAQNPVAYNISRQAINLPSALILTKTDVEKICIVLKKTIDSYRTF